MTACGVWLAPRGLVAVLVDGAGRARSCSVAFTNDARSGLALWLAAAGADLALRQRLVRSSSSALSLAITCDPNGVPLPTCPAG